MPDVTHFSHMTLTGSSGFDLYINKDEKSTYHHSFTPPIDMTNGYEGRPILEAVKKEIL